MSKARTLFNNLREKREQTAELYDKLDRSLALQDLCPVAFEHGSCKAGWVVEESGQDRNAVFRITRGDGSTITFPFDEVPDTFKLEEAAKRDITGIRRPHFHKTSFNGPIGKALIDFMEERRLKQKKQRRGERDD